MHKNQYSFTALICAYLRGCHAIYDEPKIFDDFLAYQLIPPDQIKLIEQRLVKSFREKYPEHAWRFPDNETELKYITMKLNRRNTILSRSRYTEEVLGKSIAKGIRQYVLLGAGFDTFAFRRGDLLSKLQVYEIDHPSTQTLKKRRIAELGWDIPPQLHFASTDFTLENLSTVLNSLSYDRNVKSFFSWLGVTMYLNREEVFSTLRVVAEMAPRGSVIVFNYLDIEAFDSKNDYSHIGKLMEMTRKVGEPMKIGLAPAALPSDLNHVGLRLLEDLNSDEIERRYGQGNPFAHFAQAVVM